jgi:uncharacterized protein (TIGR02145 family)
MKKYLIFLISIAVVAFTLSSCANDETPVAGAVTGVTLNQTTASLPAGDTLQLLATVRPLDATNQNVSWSSSNTAIATVSNTGFVTAVSTVIETSTATIVVTTEDGGRSTSCLVTVFPPQHCNLRTPGWGEGGLGTVSFASEETWTIGTQTWSDAVTATACQDTSFRGDTLHILNFNADCRSNPDFPGDLFSWCAVVRFAEELCPYPWRVPEKQDFIDLDIALGGTGINRPTTPQYVIDNYIERWGGSFSGGSRSNGTLWNPNSWGYYWSQTENAANTGFLLSFDALGGVRPQNWLGKGSGLSLRCVR